MHSFFRRLFAPAIVACLATTTLAAAQTPMILPGPSGRAHVKFEIRVPSSVRNEPLTGRVYAIISRLIT